MAEFESSATGTHAVAAVASYEALADGAYRHWEPFELQSCGTHAVAAVEAFAIAIAGAFLHWSAFEQATGGRHASAAVAGFTAATAGRHRYLVPLALDAGGGHARLGPASYLTGTRGGHAYLQPIAVAVGGNFAVLPATSFFSGAGGTFAALTAYSAGGGGAYLVAAVDTFGLDASGWHRIGQSIVSGFGGGYAVEQIVGYAHGFGGSFRHMATFAAGGTGGSHARAGIVTYSLDSIGRHARLQVYDRAWGGLHMRGVTRMAAGTRGRHVVRLGFAGGASGLARIANDALARYELHVGAGGPPDLSLPPTFTSPVRPFSVPLAPGGTYHLVTNYRNAYNLVSRGVEATVIAIAADAQPEPTPPSAPSDALVTPEGGDAVRITALYDYGADGTASADRFLVYATRDGSDPDPDGDASYVVPFARVDGLGKLSFRVGSLSPGQTVRAIVRMRRGEQGGPTGPASPLLVATLPVAPVGVPNPAALLGTVAKQQQLSRDPVPHP
ncbi:MAG TPA: hypothetical protein VGN72_19775 [Tepidisphaeraceae bacterium]|jgi:hypothetical protein|nr:hypothetical protein [Tepidisphaeraceae bacterium]